MKEFERNIEPIPLSEPVDLAPFLSEADFVLIGEESHGGHKAVEARIVLTEELIDNYGFTGVAIEADQEQCQPLDQYIRNLPDAPDDLPDNSKEILMEAPVWPSWTLRNEELVGFCEGVHERNQDRPPDDKVSLHGLDEYPLWGATKSLIGTLASDYNFSPEEANNALDAPLRGEPMVAEKDVKQLAAKIAGENAPPEKIEYYQELLQGGERAMRARAEHWIDTLDKLRNEAGPGEQPRIIVWAHNTHVRNEHDDPTGPESFGRLASERYGANKVKIIGEVADQGEIMASLKRAAEMEIVRIPPPPAESLNNLLPEMLGYNQAVYFLPSDAEESDWPANTYDQRFIGAVYDPESQPTFYLPIKPGESYNGIIIVRQEFPVQALHYDKTDQGAWRLE